MSEEQGGMKYITIIEPDGIVKHQVVNRGQHLCSNIYVMANRMGTITDDEELPDGDCPPVHDTAMVDGSNV
jgi:hypothetical protein